MKKIFDIIFWSVTTSLVWGGVWFMVSLLFLVFITGKTGETILLPSIFATITSTLLFIHFRERFSGFKSLSKTVLSLGLIHTAILIAFSVGEPYIMGIPFDKSILIISVINGLLIATSIYFTFNMITPGKIHRYQIELITIRMMKGVGFVLFNLAIILPFYIMVVTSFKNQQQLLLNPLDLSIDLSQDWNQLFESYISLFGTYNFGTFILNSTFVSIATVFISLFFSIPGAYAVARLRFPGQQLFFRSILIIYMVPMIVLVIPLYAIFSQYGLRNSFIGLLIVYPATTIPVAVYMLQGYFAGIPKELEEAGLIDGLSRLQVIFKITIPLSLPALASVSLYVFMIAWNEFLFAFMFLDNTSLFTLSRGVVSLNSSEVPRQYLMAGSVVATIPVLVLFLWFERFLVTGLTSGGVKG